LVEINRTLAHDPKLRPAASELLYNLAHVDVLGQEKTGGYYFRLCCRTVFVSEKEHLSKMTALKTELDNSSKRAMATLEENFKRELKSLERERNKYLEREMDMQHEISQILNQMQNWQTAYLDLQNRHDKERLEREQEREQSLHELEQLRDRCDRQKVIRDEVISRLKELDL
jgi:hypothetical protein